MRRRRGAGAAPAEACGVWLDTAELKRGRAPPLTLRAPTRAAGRKQSLVLLPQPGSREGISPRQSSILSFFSPQPDERDKENLRPAAPWEESRVKILPLPRLEGAQEEPPGAGQGLQGTARAGQTPLEPQVGPQRLSKASPGAGGDSWGWGSSNPWVSPAGTASGGRTALPGPRAGPGHTNPAPGAAPSGVCCSPQSPGPAQPLRERGQAPAGPCMELLCQGRDRDRDSPSRATRSPSRDRDRDIPTARQLLCQASRVTAHRDRDRATPSPSRDRDTPRGTPSPPRAPHPPELGSEPLFTQDSEGNRVIKHW
ncbi:aurora kinase A- and ninein-interacting protein-like [Molothrus aeneus]|uniref:aurora kinase A- and ninein-interacting protein-like n=1 Tax=Molothrus aeneus TaxID=84833 RepID=UPI0034596AA7